MSALAEIIRDEIRKCGPLTFARFMQLALYHPEFGYYRRSRKPFGREGDFYTASQLQPVFGELLKSFASKIATDHAILELGAGGRELSDAFRDWNYTGFDWDQDKLPQCFRGLVIANEFFDALPVHLLKKTTAGWRELLVGNVATGFAWEEGWPKEKDLLVYAEECGASVPDGGLLEVSLETRLWLKRTAEILTSGYFLIIDYGYSKRELDRFPEGTLLSYRKHQSSTALLEDPGSRDLTAHVNFTYLRVCALECGFEIISESSLAAWAMGIWDESELAIRWTGAEERWRLQWKQIVFGLGETFRVLLLRKV